MHKGLLTFIALVGFATTAVGTSGCGTPMHAEMLGQSIKYFASKAKPINATAKIWIAGPKDDACDSGCQNACSSTLIITHTDSKGGGFGGLGGGLFGGGGAEKMDKLAFEVFSNFYTQTGKGRVVETHRHNYASELKVETRKKQEVVSTEGKVIATGMSCEDLCLLDEAKKRNADKVLVYHILEIKNDELKIHFRLSDVISGVVESSQTIHVLGMHAIDFSPPGIGKSRGGEGGGGGGGVD